MEKSMRREPVPQPPCAPRPAITALDCGSTGAPEMSWYQGAVAGNNVAPVRGGLTAAPPSRGEADEASPVVIGTIPAPPAPDRLGSGRSRFGPAHAARRTVVSVEATSELRDIGETSG